ncbi:hypothetical protein K2F40_15085 [Clostridium sp. CM028]|uniref:hypothetical protein n=1 Tax=Clostridium sp. CM028 TaxID=2851575 RepID=UPI001C6F0821|nr:hypothetical protein [Clostridium sp. CM028]MBW9150283.1 hypothetical protein [Clostridium sp. CM028]WLC62841.1 hypothetical protein KTC94_06190 [Clostridium sp. CM028]
MVDLDNITAIYALKASSKNSVVSESNLSKIQNELYIKTKLDKFLIEYSISAIKKNKTSLIVLSGNAGDGKSMTLLKLKESLINTYNIENEKIIINADATQTDTQHEDIIEKLMDFFIRYVEDYSIESSYTYVIAMNVGIAIKFFNSQRYIDLCNDDNKYIVLKKVVLNELNIEVIDEEIKLANKELIRSILVVNFDLRCLVKPNLNSDGKVNHSFFKEMIQKVYELIDIDKCNSCNSCKCPIYFNIMALREKKIVDKIENILFKVFLHNKVHLTPRNVWDLIFHLITGGENKYLEIFKKQKNISGLCNSFKNLEIKHFSKFLFYNNLFDSNCENYILKFIKESSQEFDPIYINNIDLELIKILIMSNPRNLIDTIDEKIKYKNFIINCELNKYALENIFDSTQNLSNEVNAIDLLMNTFCRHFYFFYKDENGSEVPDILTTDKCQVFNNDYFFMFINSLVKQKKVLINNSDEKFDKDVLKIIRDVLLNTFGKKISNYEIIQLDTISTRGKGKLLGNIKIVPEYSLEKTFDVVNIEILEALDFFPNYFNVRINKTACLKVSLDIFQLLILAKSGYSITSMDLDRFNQLSLLSKKIAPRLKDESEIFYQLNKDIYKVNEDLGTIVFEKIREN